MAGAASDHHASSSIQQRQHQQPDRKAFNSYGSMSSLSGLSHSSSGWAEERRNSKNIPNRWRPSVFDFKAERSASVCPTCKGAGKIPKGQEKELVALIPYNDKRLKPPRTCLYVVLVATLLVVSGGVIAAFLYPRSVTVDILLLNTSVDQTSQALSFNFTCPQNVSGDVLVLEVKTTVRMRNSNFFPVTVNVFNVTLTNYAGDEVGVGTIPSFNIDSRSNKNVTVHQNATFIKQVQRVRTICCSGKKWRPNMYMSASVVAEYIYLSQRSTSLDQYGSDVNCQNLIAIGNATTLYPPIDEFT